MTPGIKRIVYEGCGGAGAKLVAALRARLDAQGNPVLRERARLHLATALRQRGEFSEAEVHYGEVFRTQGRALGRADPALLRTASSRNPRCRDAPRTAGHAAARFDTLRSQRKRSPLL